MLDQYCLRSYLFPRCKSRTLYGKICNTLQIFFIRDFVYYKRSSKYQFPNGKIFSLIRKKSYYKHKYSAEVEAAVNKQIKAEQQAAQDYLNLVVSFLHPRLSRPGAGGFFMKMYEEELGHMQDFVQYQLMRGGTVLIDGLVAPKSKETLTLIEAFQQALAMEKSVTELLENLVSVAEKVKDYQCADFVTSVFLAEQMRSVNEMSHHITKLCKLCDEHALYHYDLQLAKMYPYSYKSKPPG